MIFTLIGLVLFVVASYFVASYMKNKTSHPDDCVGNWSEWGKCEPPCNHKKTTSRKYLISKPKQSEKGRDCLYPHNSIESKECPFTKCPVSCEGVWTEWAACSNDCDKTQEVTRDFIVSHSNAHGGKECPSPLRESSNCPYVQCAKDCVGSFSDWSYKCEELSCGHSNTISRTYTILSERKGDGKQCSHSNGFVEYNECPFVECVQPCNGSWSSWGECPISVCGESNQVNRRYNIDYPSGDCPHKDGAIETRNCSYTPCPTECIGEFGDWDSSCSDMPCGQSNVVRRLYTVTSNDDINCANSNGYIDESNCPFVNCPIDCVGEWTDWEECNPDRSCGTPPQIINRTFNVKSNAQHGGKECSNIHNKTESMECPIIECPIHCQGTFGEWDSNCSDMPCGRSNVRKRVFSVTSNAEHGGSNCYHNGNIIEDGYIDTQYCQFVNCPRDCVGSWEDWNASCENLPEGQSNQIYRIYKIHSNAMYNGASCSNQHGEKEYFQCPFVPEPVNCEGDWKRDGPSCDVQDCGNDKSEIYIYNIIKSNQHGGDSCEYEEGDMRSNMCDPCDVCQTSWSDWSSCKNAESNCDGERTRQLTITRQGQVCDFIGNLGDVVETETSNCLPCPIDCQGEWVGDESNCLNKECGVHHYYYKYFQVTHEKNETGNCHDRGRSNLFECPYIPCCNIDCVGTWSNAYDLCPPQCSDIQHVVPQRYHIIQHRSFEGSNCLHEDGDVRYEYDSIDPVYCRPNACHIPVDCEGEWSNIKPCEPDTQCNTSNLMIDKYIVKTASKDGGSNCVDPVEGSTRESNCPIIPCPDVDCQGHWSNAPELCSTNCLNENDPPSLIPQVYHVRVHKEYNGRDCEASNEQIRYKYDYEGSFNTYCHQEECPKPVDCEGYFSNITPCSHFDNTYENYPMEVCNQSNLATYEYVITQSSSNGGSNCKYIRGATSNLMCERLPCPIPCEGHWSNDKPCPEECAADNEPIYSRYVITQEASNGGSECPHKDGETGSNMCDLCVKPCEYTINYYTECPTKCIDPTLEMFPERHGYYVITSPAMNGGYCEYSNNQHVSKQCENVTYCDPVDCVGEWSNITECPIDVRCVDGTEKPIYKQEYVVKVPSNYGGNECSNVGEQRSLECDISYCPMHCVGYWSNIENEVCPDICYSNDKYEAKLNKPDTISVRRYHVSKYELHGGSNCPHSNLEVEHSNCPVKLCPEDCIGYWSNIQPCPTDCHYDEVNPYNSIQQYFVDRYPNETGNACDAEHGASNIYECPNNQCPPVKSTKRFAVKNCVWGHHNYDECSANDDKYPGGDTCYHKNKISVISVDDEDTPHSSVAVRCFDGKKGSTIAGTHGVTTHAQAKTICESNDARLPRNVDELGAACGTGHGYDAYHIWMGESYVPPVTNKL